MRLPLALGFAALLLALSLSNGLSRLAAADQPAAVIWRLDQTAQVGGHATTVLGEPHVVTEADGKAVRFNGASDGIFVPVNPLQGLAQFTIELLLKPEAGGLPEQRFFHLQDTPGSRAMMEIRLHGDDWALDTFLLDEKSQSKLPLLDEKKLHPVDRWTWVALVYANGHMAHYINGVKELEGEVAMPPMAAGQISLGVRQNKVYWFKGSIREVRFHPVALAPKALQHPAAK